MAAPVTFLNCRFLVAIDGIPVTSFAEVILPDARAAIAEYREGNENTAQKSAGAVSYGDLVLRRGVTTTNELSQWWQNVAGGKTDKRNLSVTLRDEQLNPVRTWQITNACPARYAIAPLIAIDGTSRLWKRLSAPLRDSLRPDAC
jgi:phage tail-like protein